MNLSYWEYKTWLFNIDFTIIGSGIVGLNCALSLRKKYPNAKILVLEKGVFPQGASTKNAGFACFGSISEVLSDLRYHSEAEVVQLVEKRWNGIQLLRRTLGDKAIDFQQHGGHELFLETDESLFQNCKVKLDSVNELLTPVFGSEPFTSMENRYNFEGIFKEYVTNTFEGQIDTGKMMASLLQKVRQNGITILNNIAVETFSDNGAYVSVKVDKFELKTRKLLVATNGFASELLPEIVRPARAQVLVTKPIKNLHIKGTFHLEEGYYYFRNINNRILLGGGRNLDIDGEETTEFGETELIQKKLEKMLREIILPDTDFKIESRWSGIMGMGDHKKPIIKQLSGNVYYGVRLGGMGIAIGSLVGKELADLVE
jgi:glycine/D-amino acid oxidase-like deaminating enzyme